MLLFLSLPFCGPARAGRRAVVVLRPELTAEGVLGPRTPFSPLLARAAIGVMNTAVRGPREPASAYLTLGAGERLAAGPLDSPARFPEEIIEGDPAAEVYARRLGPLPRPLPRLIDVDWAAYLNIPHPDYSPEEQDAAGGLGQALRGRGGAAWLGVGDAARTRFGALLAVDGAGTARWAETVGRSGDQAFGRSGIRAFGPADRTDRTDRSDRSDPSDALELENSRIPDRAIGDEVTVLLRRSPLLVIDLPASFSVERLAELLQGLATDPGRDLLLVSPYPPPGPGGAWDRLPPVMGIGPDFQPGLLTSATTRTRGLVANIDVAPTLLALLGLPQPWTMSGRVMQCEAVASGGRGGRAGAAALLRFARGATLANRAIIPIGVSIEGSAVLVLALVVMALSGVSRASPLLPRIASAAMLLVAALPLGLLLGTVTEPRTVLGLGLAIAGWSVAGVLAAVLGSRVALSHSRKTAGAEGVLRSGSMPPPPLIWLAGLTLIVVAGDLLLGGRLIERSPLSGFPVSGIRFYGVGNEYMGVLVGMGIVAPLAFEERLARFRWAQAGLFLGLLLLIGSPRFGANFGGAMAGAAGFGATLTLALWPRRPLRALFVAIGALALAGAGALLWDALRPAAARSHIGDFARAVWQGGWSAAAPVLRRKAAMDLRILTSGFAAIPLAGVAPLIGIWYRRAGRWLSALLTRRPELRAATGGALVGAWTGLFLKDSGVTPWMFIMGSALAVLLDEQLRAAGRV